MPLCQHCGVNMTVSEVTQRRDGVQGNWHVDCAYMEYLVDAVQQSGDYWIHGLICAKQRLADKKNALATEFP